MGGWSSCVGLASATRSGTGGIQLFTYLLTERSVIWSCRSTGRSHCGLFKGGMKQSEHLYWTGILLYQIKMNSSMHK